MLLSCEEGVLSQQVQTAAAPLIFACWGQGHVNDLRYPPLQFLKGTR